MRINQYHRSFVIVVGNTIKNYWEAVLENPVEVNLLESVIMGDKVCKFTLYLPEEIVKSVEI